MRSSKKCALYQALPGRSGDCCRRGRSWGNWTRPSPGRRRRRRRRRHSPASCQPTRTAPSCRCRPRVRRRHPPSPTQPRARFRSTRRRTKRPRRRQSTRKWLRRRRRWRGAAARCRFAVPRWPPSRRPRFRAARRPRRCALQPSLTTRGYAHNEHECALHQRLWAQARAAARQGQPKWEACRACWVLCHD